MFDEEPDAPLHGECAAEIGRLTAEIDRLNVLARGFSDELDTAMGVQHDLESERNQLLTELANLRALIKEHSEPVLWIDPDDLKSDCEAENMYVTRTSFDGNTIPLYTHPILEK